MASNSLVKLRDQVNSLKARHTKAVKHAHRGFKVLGDAGVIAGTMVLAGYVQGRYGAVKIPRTNIPVDLTLATGFYIAGMMEPFGGGAAHQSFNIANSLFGSHLLATGRGAGKKARVKAGKAPLTEGAQDSEVASMLEGLADGGGTLSDEDLVRLANSI